MNIISIGGMLTLLGIAWLLSNNKKNIKLKPVFWGISLQFLFAIIILKEDYWSFIGMGILGILIIIYLLHSENKKIDRKMVFTVFTSIILGTIIILISISIIGSICLSLIAIDWGRFINIHLVSIFFLLLLPSIQKTKKNLKSPKVVRKSIVILFIIYTLCWHIPHSNYPMNAFARNYQSLNIFYITKPKFKLLFL